MSYTEACDGDANMCLVLSILDRGLCSASASLSPIQSESLPLATQSVYTWGTMFKSQLTRHAYSEEGSYFYLSFRLNRRGVSWRDRYPIAARHQDELNRQRV